jgi:hypothetical protein
MLDNFIFENHLGERFVGLENGVYLNYSDLRNYSWNYDTINSRISRFYKPITKRKIPLVIYCDSDEAAIAVKNHLMELAEADVEAKIPGKVFVGEYYTIGYITASKKSDYLTNKRLCKIELTLTSDDPSWYNEETFTFPIGGIFDPDNPSPGEDDDFEGIIPEGTLNIIANGNYDVARYAVVSVDVEGGGTSTITVTHDGNGNVTLLGVSAASDENGNVTVA